MQYNRSFYFCVTKCFIRIATCVIISSFCRHQSKASNDRWETGGQVFRKAGVINTRGNISRQLWASAGRIQRLPPPLPCPLPCFPLCPASYVILALSRQQHTHPLSPPASAASVHFPAVWWHVESPYSPLSRREPWETNWEQLWGRDNCSAVDKTRVNRNNKTLTLARHGELCEDV